MNKREALDIIALHHAEGKVSDELLSKVSDAYRVSSQLDADLGYHVCVTKSLVDKLNGSEQDQEIAKAIIPGQTKVINGVVYIYAATPGAKTQYDWRVYRGGKVGRQVADTDAENKERVLFANSLFPKSLDDLSEVNGQKVGGSTGAKLMEDSDGNRYIVKAGSNTSSEHVKSEYLATQLYSLLGLSTPEMELYEKNGEKTLVSRFILGCRNNNSWNKDDAKAMAAGFIADVFLANRDVYNNGDNTLIDANGVAVRVDNGACLNFRSRGGKKTFDDDFASDFESMSKYNQSITDVLDDKDIDAQLKSLLDKRDDVIAFLKIEGNASLVKTMEKRFDSVKKFLDERNAPVVQKTVKPRVIKDAIVMYRNLTDDEIADVWDGNKDSNTALYSVRSHIGKNGWEALSKIAALRGFDGRPNVVSKAEYDKMKANGDMYLPAGFSLWRGVSNDRRGTPARPNIASETYVEQFKYDDNCFFGSVGIFGQGIYSHIDEAPSPKDKTAINHAKSYARQGYGEGTVFELNLEKDAKVIAYSELVKKARKEYEALTDGGDEAKAARADIEAHTKALEKANEDFKKKTENIEKDIKKKMGWDDEVFKTFRKEIDSVAWGDVDDEGRAKFPKFDDFVLGKIKSWVEKCGGSVNEIRPNYFELSLPHSNVKYGLSRKMWNDESAIRQRQSMGVKYHMHAKAIGQWMESQHFQKIQDNISKETADQKTELVNKHNQKTKEIRGKIDEANKRLRDAANEVDPKESMRNAILHSCFSSGNNAYCDSSIGVLAAIDGYDAIEVSKSDNQSSNRYMVILNRTKVITHG